MGTLRERNNEEDWSDYIGCVRLFFKANDIEDEGKKRTIFLLVVEAKHYAVLRVLANNRPKENTFDELVELMQRHIKPALNLIHERFL